jgi:hypothetical protein
VENVSGEFKGAEFFSQGRIHFSCQSKNLIELFINPRYENYTMRFAWLFLCSSLFGVVWTPPQKGRPPAQEASAEFLLPPGRACPIRAQGGGWADVALILWQSKMWGLEFAGKSSTPTGESTPNIVLNEKAFVPDFAWRPGFKLGVGSYLPYDGWDVDARWTYYRGEGTHLKKHFTSQLNPAGLGIIPLWFYPFYNVEAPNQIRFQDGLMSWRHYFNSIDLEIGRDSRLGNRIELRIFGGLKGAWAWQTYHVTYEGGGNINAILPGTFGTVPYQLLASSTAFKNKSRGLGPRAGFDSKWNLGWGFSLLADAAFSLLYSNFEITRNGSDLNLNTSTNLQALYKMKQRSHFGAVKPVMEMTLGFDWARCVFTNSLIDFSLAYEVQYWWEQNELRRNYSHELPATTMWMKGDLQMHGLTLTAGYSY